QKHEQWERRWGLADLKAAALGRAYLWASPSVRSRVNKQINLPTIDLPEVLPGDAETLVVAGGGTAIDRAKHFRMSHWPALRLIAIPTLWGSGAEVSPVAVLSGQKKEIHFSDDLIPDQYVAWPELAQSAPHDLLRFACGDVWAHALEAFCSPLATEAIRGQAAELMNEIADYPIGFDERWFDAGAAACLLQARSSVGLIHGIAHVIEPILRSSEPMAKWGHARLCSTLILPVLNFNLSRSAKVETLAAQFGLKLDSVRAATQSLFSEADYLAVIAVAEQHWETIARDRCSRTNCILVRRDSFPFFQQFLASGVKA
ncbi:MAG TPA: iron-containing alcohol dehydrogenase, partial [Terriglobales bacterium]|nr:iron-containing alcohol dehydrogenase [Terriglobales bacterium]